MGLLVAAVSPASPAARAGFRPGDLLLTVAGKPATSKSLSDFLAAHQPGTRLTIEYTRAGTHRTAQLTLATRQHYAYLLQPGADLTPQQAAILRDWLRTALTPAP